LKRIGPPALALAGWCLLWGARAAGAVLTVTNTGDSGPGSLRQALLDSNAMPGADTVVFDIPGGGVQTITPLSPLPILVDPAGVTVDGYTQPGASPNALETGDDAVLTVELDGSAAGSGATGLTLQSLSNIVRGLVINRFGTGIRIAEGSDNQVTGCFIGTDPAGSTGRGNRTGIVVSPLILGGTVVPSAVTIGGSDPALRNLISSNTQDGIVLYSAVDSAVLGNYVGTDASGSVALGNGEGVALLFTNGVSVGGSSPGEGNLVSGNTGAGLTVSFAGPGSVAGNRIGVDAAGTGALPNGVGIFLANNSGGLVVGGAVAGSGNLVSANASTGIRMIFSTGTTIAGNRIGVDTAGMPLPNLQSGISIAGSTNNLIGGGSGAGNLIAFNGQSGVAVGTSATDTSSGNQITGNAIHDNGGLGIDLGSDGPTPNDSGDADAGPNLLQNAPALTAVTAAGASTTIEGTLASLPGTTFRIEFFKSGGCDPSGFGEGAVWIGATDVVTDGAGDASFAASVPLSIALGEVVTATATDPNGNTSEFSPCFPAALSFYTLTPCRVVDTRGAAGDLGGPALAAGQVRAFALAGNCGIPQGAEALSVNVTVTQSTAAGDLAVFAAGVSAGLPLIEYRAGQTRANNAVVHLSESGALSVSCGQPAGTVHVIVDVTGYFQ
jgi:hypothetical protein